VKIILSRKGFDSAAGGYPSPYFVENNRLLSFPIPEDESNSIDTGRTYADLRYDKNSSYLDIMKQLGLKKFEGRYAHLDPDVNAAVLDHRKNDWRGLFGQSSSAQAHLNNKGVKSGDLFLFFGWFRGVIKTANGYKYVSGTDKHIIWGYLQVEEIQRIEHRKDYEAWKLEHPHYYYKHREQNTGYIARKSLSFAPHLPGYGTFNYKNGLVLTSPGQKKRSVWRLPQYFHPSFGTVVSYHENLCDKSNNPVWELHDNHCTLNSVGRGQEFVIRGNDEIIKWAMQLFEDR
jgi:hypothetical protein